MVQQLDAPTRNPFQLDDSVGRALLADSQVSSDTAKPKSAATPFNQSYLDIPPLSDGRISTQVAMFVNTDVPDEKPKEKLTPAKLAEKSQEDATKLAGAIKTQFNVGDLKQGDREEIHSAFHAQLAKSEGMSSKDRATALRSFVDQVNTGLRKDNGKLSFREDSTGNANKLSFSLVDKGDKNLVDGLPQRTVYDTMEYALKKEDQIVNNMPDRETIPSDLKEPYDYAFQLSKESAMKKYGPALESVVKETKLRELGTAEERNKALGLKPDASSAEITKELERRMMVKLGEPGKDYHQEFSKDVDKAFMKTLDLKPGIATTKDIEAALTKLKASVPKDFKRDTP